MPAVARPARNLPLAFDHPHLTHTPRSTRPTRGALLRVSDESRKKFQSTLADDLDWLTWNEHASWIKANVTNVEAFRKGPTGDAERARLGMTPVYAEATERLIGGRIELGEWTFLFLLTTAAKSDLPGGGNSATQAIRSLLLQLQTDDPHDQDGRSILYAHALDRIIREELFAWQTFHTLVETYVLVDAAGRPFDALRPNSKDEWTLITFGAARGRDDTARRFLVKRLNKARAGDWPGTEIGLPNGFRASAEPDSHGRWHLNPEHDPRGDLRIVRRPEPDPRQRWSVQLVANLFAQPLSFQEIATRCGEAGMRSRGADEQHQTLDQLSDLTSAGKLLLSPEKIRAYLTGLLIHTETGVTPGQFTPGDGHKLLPRYSGDVLGAASYDVRVGRPEDDGWSFDVPRSTWRTILETRYLPEGYRPDGWSWEDQDWNWQAIFDACRGSEARQAPTGRHAANQELRPLSGQVAFSDDTARNALFAKTGSTDPEAERYEWRREPLTHARRSQSGELYAMTSTSGVTVSSWKAREMHAAVADMLRAAVLATLDGDVPLDRLFSPPAPITHLNRAANLRQQTAAKRQQAKRTRDDAEGYGLKAARALRNGDEQQAAEDEAREKELKAAAALLEQEAHQLEQQAAPGAEPASARVADFGLVTNVIGVLVGAYACGAAPRALNDALGRLLRGSLELWEIDAATVEVTAIVHLPLADGTTHAVPVSTVIGRSRPRHTRRTDSGTADASAAQRGDRIGALVQRYWTGGCSQSELLELARSQDREYWLKRMREHCPENVTDPGLQLALTAHPLGTVRAAVAGGAAALPAPLTNLIEAVYTGPGTWQRKYATNPLSDHRLAAVSVLAALPDPASPLRTDHLAELLGCQPRNITTVSAPLTRGGCTLPGTLIRPNGWEGRAASLLPAEQRTVALPACPWTDCTSPIADGLCLLPEVVLGAGSTVLCRQCLRAPTLDVVFAGYGPLLAVLLPGAWVRCSARDCRRNLGAGPGLLWRWSDNRGQVQHHDCRQAA